MSYKTSLRPQLATDSQNDKYRVQAQTLQELFPAWSNDDLQSLLAEVGGDVELAATRISEGHAEQWGSVTRKKEKKPSAPTPSQSKDSHPTSRGGRGARGGRSSSSRGGNAARGARGTGLARSTHTHSRSHSVANSNGRASPAQVNTDKETSADAQGWGDPIVSTDQNVLTASTTGWESNAMESSSGWGASSASTAAWGTDSPSVQDVTDVGTSNVNLASGPAVSAKPAPSTIVKTSKVPPGSKLSWAQIAKPQDKTSPAPAVSVPSLGFPPPSAATNPTTSTSQSQSVVQEPEPILVPNASVDEGWEEPTTVQAPTWDDEPVKAGVGMSRSSTSTTEGWEEVVMPTGFDAADQSNGNERKEEITEQVIQAAPEMPQPFSHPQPHPSQLEEPRKASSTPTRIGSGVGGIGRRYKTIADQPVVMPPVVGGFGLEKVGMQFGSLSLGGESLLDGESPMPEPIVHEPPSQQPRHSPQTTESPAPTSPSASAALSTGHAAFQAISSQVQSQAAQQSPAALQQSQHTLPSSIPQTQTSSHQAQIQQLHQYAQHGLPTHVDPTQAQAQTHTPPTQAHVQHSPPQQHSQLPSQVQQQAQNHSNSYFRQEQYFHTHTPPQGPDYNTFGQGTLGQVVTGQVGLHQQHQGVGVSVGGTGHHLPGFGQGDYGYQDGQRGFYDSYAQGGFGNRNVLGHDEVKGLAGTQQPSAGTVLPPTNSQSSQHPPGSQPSGQPQPSGGQGPQQYPPPVPYYYPFPQNQYYGTPYNSGYAVPQPFVNVKYPTMFPAPSPGSAPSPATKQGPGNVQSQTAPYGQSLYSQQHPSAGSYDDLGYPHHSQHSQHQNVANNLPPANDYGKQLYGGHTTQGMQGFIGGLGQGTAGPGSSVPQRGGGASPEAPYKPYAPNVGAVSGVKDVGSGGIGPGQGPQGRTGAQQPHAQGGFYGNRFAGSAGGGPQGGQSHQHHQGHQGQGPQGHLGYGQGAGDGNFYSYQRGQQGYWQ